MSTNLRVTALGAVHSKGKAKNTGNPFDMAQLLYTRRIEHFANANMVRTGYGFEASEMQLAPEAINKFSGFDFPCELDLEIGTQLNRFGKLEAVVIGAKAVPPLKAAA